MPLVQRGRGNSSKELRASRRESSTHCGSLLRAERLRMASWSKPGARVTAGSASARGWVALGVVILAVLRALLGLQAQVLAQPLVALRLELKGKLRPARLNYTARHHNMDVVGLDVVEYAL